jgi:5'-3' exonuclease
MVSPDTIEKQTKTTKYPIPTTRSKLNEEKSEKIPTIPKRNGKKQTKIAHPIYSFDSNGKKQKTQTNPEQIGKKLPKTNQNDS